MKKDIGTLSSHIQRLWILYLDCILPYRDLCLDNCAMDIILPFLNLMLVDIVLPLWNLKCIRNSFPVTYLVKEYLGTLSSHFEVCSIYACSFYFNNFVILFWDYILPSRFSYKRHEDIILPFHSFVNNVCRLYLLSFDCWILVQLKLQWLAILMPLEIFRV